MFTTVLEKILEIFAAPHSSIDELAPLYENKTAGCSSAFILGLSCQPVQNGALHTVADCERSSGK